MGKSLYLFVIVINLRFERRKKEPAVKFEELFNYKFQCTLQDRTNVAKQKVC